MKPPGYGYKSQERPWPPGKCAEKDQSVVMGFHLILFLNTTGPERTSPIRVGMRWGGVLLRALALRGFGVDWTSGGLEG